MNEKRLIVWQVRLRGAELILAGMSQFGSIEEEQEGQPEKGI